MTPEWNEREVFLKALEVEPAKREEFLQDACPDEVSRERIRTLLRYHDQTTATLPFRAPESLGPQDPPRIDEFEIFRRLGAGGMGVVYLAEDTILGRRVAVKVLAPELTGSEESIARFRAEARNAAGLKHPGIVAVHRFGFDGTRHYIVGEFVDGRTLGEVIEQERRQRPPQPHPGALRPWHRRCAELAAAVAEALEYSHRAGIIHRDVKPSNILIDESGNARLTDFGIAKQVTAKTLTGDRAGSCYYMSPEQARIAKEGIDRRSDVFSLGVVLHEMLALRRPFDGPDVEHVLRAVIWDPAPRLRAVDHTIPRDLEVICAKALEKQPAERYQSAAHLAADLRSFLAGDPILARPPGIGRKARRWSWRHRFPIAAGMAGAGACVAGLVAWSWHESRQSSLGHLSIQSDIPGCVAEAWRLDDDTLVFEAEPRATWHVPVSAAVLDPGVYRITVRDEAGRLAEFSLPLTELGRANRTVLQVDDRTLQGRWSTADSRLQRAILQTGDAAPRDMVLVPAGLYAVGDQRITEGRFRKQEVHLDAFYIDIHEVSNAEFKEFVDRSGYRVEGGGEFVHDATLGEHPVVRITLRDAEAYARWHGKRLPTLFEWEAATRGPAGAALFPWGDDPQQAPSELAPPPGAPQTTEQALRLDYAQHTLPVAADDPARCDSGVLHAFDNVLEWTGTVLRQDQHAVVKGRAWHQAVADRDLGRSLTTRMTDGSYVLGFRCAKSAQPGVALTP